MDPKPFSATDETRIGRQDIQSTATVEMKSISCGTLVIKSVVGIREFFGVCLDTNPSRTEQSSMTVVAALQDRCFRLAIAANASN
jgi:hypothetical protein